MPIPLRQLVDANVRSIATVDGPPPDPADCHRVGRVAKASPAGIAGVEKGDLLAALQDRPAADAAPDLDATHEPERRYLFFSAARGTSTRLVATGLPVGVELERTVANVLRDFEKRPAFEDLKLLWSAGEWKALEELSRLFLTGSRKPPGLLRRVLGGGDPKRRGTPALLFLGAALFEQGSREEGTKLVAEFVENTAEGWTMDYQGIAQLYVGLACLERDDDEDGMARLGFAWEHTEAPRIADLIQELSMQRPQPPDAAPWKARRFPVDYSCEPLAAGGRGASLAESLRALPEGKLHVVCLLGGYRINGPYNDFMRRFRLFGRYFAPYLHELHVITGNPQQVPEQYAHFLEGERGAIADGLPVAVALDRGGEVSAAIDAGISPCVLLLDGEGTVFHQGWLRSVDLWDLLASRHP